MTPVSAAARHARHTPRRHARDAATPMLIRHFRAAFTFKAAEAPRRARTHFSALSPLLLSPARLICRLFFSPPPTFHCHFAAASRAFSRAATPPPPLTPPFRRRLPRR